MPTARSISVWPALVVLVLCLWITSYDSKPAGQRLAEDAAERIFAAIAKHDLDELRWRVAEDAHFRMPDGSLIDRAAWLSLVAADANAIESITGRELKASVYSGHIAIISGVQRVTANVEGKRVVDDVPFCDVYAWRRKNWLLIYSYTPSAILQR